MSDEVKIFNLTVSSGEISEDDIKEVKSYGLAPEELLKDLNLKLSKLKGKEVKVRIYVYPKSRDYIVEVLPPPVSDILLWKAGAKEPSGDPAHKKVGDIGIEALAEVAIALKDELKAKTLKNAVKTLLGTAKSIGLTVNGKDPKEVVKELESGAYNEVLDKYNEEYEKA
ncbi:MAG: 50S ribosomal protein L11 [Fervidicoccaceae archaeon]|jgi:large subunit ribosomal protein L11|uniref:Large ribosomal subunit protein uL11 n=1 Tax=Fervidicoccus fontis TaxID=683846 RepID=A0A7C2UPW5_9CREN|nr:MAG: 50S ribosomal protein L11 [Fervidicoccus sp.]HEU97407.1 50S ribosomal protein L11 [Fervidicoccus fontis]